ncbi:hypothetical protein [Leifsonia aquatica]|uniref:Uncharacterized protein n=2 Tax=Leifsonia aquatica TaxID=144185 RepID=U2RXT7_LEIAQ|nr:hypothetical protein [Leifsonia aquatica]ERK73546.1 hypothetical protein N136_00104 [Leifsonia aquatica ATCC 14665]MBB2967994.1 hypothetical protein [Leifsonia aquatica]
MSDNHDEEFERWVRDVVAPGAGELGEAVVVSVAEEAQQRASDGVTATSEGVPFVGVPVAPHVADVLRATQPTRVAPEEWLGGVWEVVTESGSRYVIDTIGWTLTRVRGLQEQEDPEVAPASTLRRDGEPLRLLRVITLEVGKRAVFDVEPLRPDAVWTRRSTTYVVEIRLVRSNA